jgi:multiple sugar transport system substrate-binding protein
VLPYAAPGTLEYDSADSGDAFLRGDVAMNANWGFLAGKAVDPSASNVVDTWAATAIPKGLEKRTPFLGGWVLSTLANSKNKEAAFLFFEYASTPENMKKIALDPTMGTVPSRTSVLSDPDIVAKFPHYPAFVDSLESSIARPSVPEFLEMWDRLTIGYTDYLTDQKGLDEATAWCQAEWDELLA